MQTGKRVLKAVFGSALTYSAPQMPKRGFGIFLIGNLAWMNSSLDAQSNELALNLMRSCFPLGLIAVLGALMVSYVLVANAIDQHVKANEPASFMAAFQRICRFRFGASYLCLRRIDVVVRLKRKRS